MYLGPEDMSVNANSPLAATIAPVIYPRVVILERRQLPVVSGNDAELSSGFGLPVILGYKIYGLLSATEAHN